MMLLAGRARDMERTRSTREERVVGPIVQTAGMVQHLQAADELRRTATDIGTWTAVVVGIAAALIAWLTYRSQRGRKGLEYLVLSTQRLVDPRVAEDLDVHFDGRPVDDPSLTVLRMVSTGDRGIASETFESPLRITFEGASKVVHASVSAVRPSGVSRK
jgi:hypothetical protein